MKHMRNIVTRRFEHFDAPKCSVCAVGGRRHNSAFRCRLMNHWWSGLCTSFFALSSKGMQALRGIYHPASIWCSTFIASDRFTTAEYYYVRTITGPCFNPLHLKKGDTKCQYWKSLARPAKLVFLSFKFDISFSLASRLVAASPRHPLLHSFFMEMHCVGVFSFAPQSGCRRRY